MKFFVDGSEPYEGLLYLGSSKFDKLRRISLIKLIADMFGIREGEEVSYYTDGEFIIIKRRKVFP